VKNDLCATSATRASRAYLAGGYVITLILALSGLVAGAPALAQPDSSEHESHHPQPGPPAMAGKTPPVASSGMGGKGPGGAGPGMMGGMDSMMQRMGVPPPRELYPEMMRLEDLTLDRRQDLLKRAQKRRADGSARLSQGLEELDRTMRGKDSAALFEALGEARAGLNELESGLATERALEAGKEPRRITLDWLRDEMSIETPIGAAPATPFQVGWFHAFVMALLTGFAIIMIGMYFFKMRRAATLLAELAEADARPAATSSPPPPTKSASPSASPSPSPSPSPPAAAPISAPTTGPGNSAFIFEALRKSGSCSDCKSPCATRVRVAHINEESPGVKTFRLTPLDGGPMPFEYLPGQFLNVIVPAQDNEGGTTKRSYTIASSPTQAAFCEITVKREPEGVVSRYLHDTIHAGDELRIAAPYGRFTFTGDAADSIVLIGCGVGITPLMSSIRYLTDRAWLGEIVLFFGFRTPADFIFREELERLQRRHPNLRVIPTVSRAEGTDWNQRTGRIGPELVREFVPDIAERLVHLCGPKPMMDATRDFLLELDVPRERIRYESFGPAATPKPSPEQLKQASKAGAPTVEFVRSQKSAPLPAGLTILDVAETVDVEIEWSCRSGTCGLCSVKLLSGEVEMETDDGLDSDDREAGMVLACQAHATADVAVEA